MLAIIFACKKFRQYIYGKPNIIIHTDHKPLIRIIKKPLNGISTRLQKMRLRLQQYDIKLEFIPGKFYRLLCVLLLFHMRRLPSASIHVIPAHARLVPVITHAHSCVAVSHDRTSRRGLLIYSGPPLYIIMTNKAINNHLSLDALYNNVHNDNYITERISR